MARYYVPNGYDLATVARELLDAADHPAQVVYVPEGANGAFDLPDELADRYTPQRAEQVYADEQSRLEGLRTADAAVRQAPAPHEPTLEDLRVPEQKTNVVTGTYAPEDAPKTRRRGGRQAARSSDKPSEE